MAFKPIPTEKLSRLTARPNISNSLNLIKVIFFSFLNESIIISIPINNKTIKTIIFVDIGNIVINLFPNHIPNNGIIK